MSESMEDVVQRVAAMLFASPPAFSLRVERIGAGLPVTLWATPPTGRGAGIQIGRCGGGFECRALDADGGMLWLSEPARLSRARFSERAEDVVEDVAMELRARADAHAALRRAAGAAI